MSLRDIVQNITSYLGNIQPAAQPAELQSEQPNQVLGNVATNIANMVQNPPTPSLSQEKPSVSGYEDLNELKQQFAKEQEKKKADAQATAESIVNMNFGAMGFNPYDDPLYQQQVNSTSEVDRLPTIVDDAYRRLKDGNLLGFTSQNKSDETTKNLYEEYFKQQEQSGEEPSYSITDKLTGKDQFGNDVVDKNLIDDGTRPGSREAMYMTGEQYEKYINDLGMPGRPIEEINPKSIYSKQDEMEKYGFMPYIATDEGLDRFHDQAAINAVNNTFNGLADLRRTLTNYTYDFDGKKIDGEDFQKRYNVWKERVADQVNEEPTEEPRDENSIPLTWVMTDVNGNKHYTDKPGEIKEDEDTGLIVIDFGGDPDDNWYFNDADDMNNSIRYEIAQDGQHAFAWRNIDPLVLSDGTTLRGDRADELALHGDQYADYGNISIGKPSVDNIFEDPGAVVPWFVDNVLGSVPLFYRPTAGAQAVGSTMANLQGMKSGYANNNGEYKLVASDPTNENRWLTSAASAALPITERIWGNLATPIWKPITNKVAKTNPTLAESPLFNWLTGTIGEGAEEIPGNLVEEAQGRGQLNKMFANPMYRDENGNLTKLDRNPNTNEEYYQAFDEYNNPIYDTDTELRDRLWNFAQEIPQSFVGGAALGGILGVPGAKASAAKAKERAAERDVFGSNLEIPKQVREYTDRMTR